MISGGLDLKCCFVDDVYGICSHSMVGADEIKR